MVSLTLLFFSALGFMILTILLIFRTEIMVFIFPQNYNMIFMKELDGNITFWYQYKKEDLTFNFRGGLYYMTHPKALINGGHNEKSTDNPL